jgi:hypothetical protein
MNAQDFMTRIDIAYTILMIGIVTLGGIVSVLSKRK